MLETVPEDPFKSGKKTSPADIWWSDLVFRRRPFVIPRMQHLDSARNGGEALGAFSTVAHQQQKWYDWTETKLSPEKVSPNMFLNLDRIVLEFAFCFLGFSLHFTALFLHFSFLHSDPTSSSVFWWIISMPQGSTKESSLITKRLCVWLPDGAPRLDSIAYNSSKPI